PRHVGQPNIGDRSRLMRRIEEMLDRRVLTNDGPLVREFEERVGEISGVRHCVAMSSGTVALETAIQAADMKGEVITTPWTFIATTHALRRQGIRPVFCDVNAATHNIDPERVEGLITERTTGILAVHLWGRACDVDALTEIADNAGIRLLFDSAHAFACSHKGTVVGGFGDAEVFSFHGTKFVNAFEGGALVTDDDDIADRARRIRNFGFAGYDRIESLGTNGKMSEASAAMGLTSLESMEAFIEVNHRNYETYRSSLDGVPGVGVMPFPEGRSSTRQYIVLEVSPTAPLTRDQLQQVLWGENVLARRYFYPGSHRSEPYMTEDPAARESMPSTDALARSVLTLPTGTGMSTDDVLKVGELVTRAMAEAEALSTRLPLLGAPGGAGRPAETGVSP
ncbi:MAG: aminotransferase class I/II-fold pyridoxal phosphate-dependent enzyme, partial [Chloroflexota bacterium]|nr:aminotransferase class I/II-fold pyridoxal phosphate-dependent enzyme [Chloroflexota bacterium]